MKRFLSAFILFMCLFSSFADAQSDVVLGEPIVLFDGQTLEQWQGREGLWSVEDGMIVGRTSDKDPIKENTFLVFQNDETKNGKIGDFELTIQFKIESGNSGIQYRSKILDQEKFIVGGYQADIDFGNEFAGILYEEKGRGILALRGESVTIDDDGEKLRKRFGEAKALGNGIHPGQWNDFRIVARGNHLEHYINGAKTMELVDNQPSKAATSGVIALQLHRGPAMTVRFKNIALTPFISAAPESKDSPAEAP